MRHATHPIPRLLATVALFTIVAGTLTSARSAATAAEDPSDDGPPVPARRDAALIERWGRTALTGPIPDRPAEVIAPPPIPEECLVWATGLDSRHAREALFCAHLGPDGTPPDDPHDPPTPGRWASLSATDPGMWTGDFDHAFLRVTCQPSAIVFARLSGAETLIVNGAPFHGDLERRGLRGVPVQLQVGDNELYIVGADGGFEFALWAPETRIVIGTWDARMVDFDGDGRAVPAASTLESVEAALFVPVFNASVSDAKIHFHYGHLVPDGPGIIPPLHEWADGGDIGPLCLMVKSAYAHDLGEPWPADSTAGVMSLCAFDNQDQDADRRAVRVARDDPSLLRAPRPISGGESLVCDPETRGFPLIVRSTAGDPEQRDAALAVARWLQQRLWYQYAVPPRVVADHELPDDLEESSWAAYPHIVLIGDARQSLASRSLARFDDLRPFLPDDIARDQDPHHGLRIVGPDAMPGGIPATLTLIHSRTAEGLRLFTALDLADDPRLIGDSFEVLPPARTDDTLTLVRVGR